MYSKVGTFIKELRKEKNITQEQLAKKINVSVKVVSKWETGERQVGTEMIKPLCKVLGISEKELLDGKRSQKGKLLKIVILFIIIVFIISIIFGIYIIKPKQYKEVNEHKELYYITHADDEKNFSIEGFIYNSEKYNLLIINNLSHIGNEKINYARVEVYLDNQFIIASTRGLEDVNLSIEDYFDTFRLSYLDTSKQFNKCFKEDCNIELKIVYTTKKKPEKENDYTVHTKYRIYR